MTPVQGKSHGWDTRAIEHGTKQASMFAVAIPFIIITSIVLALRIHVKLHLLSMKLMMDDYLMIFGGLFTFGLSIANMICGWYGAGMHTIDIPTENLEPLLKANLATRLLYAIAVSFIKCSILVFYAKLDHRRPTRWIIYFLMALIVVYGIATFFLLTFVCVPPSLFWKPAEQMLHPEKCLKQSAQQTYFNINGILNIVQDVAIFLLPIPMLWKLQMPRRQKLALMAVLCVGLVAVAAGCIRFYYVLFLAHEDDIWWYMADSLNWCSIELYAAIIGGSASTFKAMIKTYLPRIWGSSRKDSTNPRHRYDGSESGQFALKPFGSGSNKMDSVRKYGVGEITEFRSDSEEAIVAAQMKDEGDLKDLHAR